MSNKNSVLSYEKVSVNNKLAVGKQITIPVITLTGAVFNPPPDTTVNALGIGPDGLQYTWVVAENEWVLSSGSDSTNWTSNNNFAS